MPGIHTMQKMLSGSLSETVQSEHEGLGIILSYRPNRFSIIS